MTNYPEAAGCIDEAKGARLNKDNGRKRPRLPDAGQWSLKFSPAGPLASVLAVYRLSPGRITSETTI